jgi:guanylate kinase
MLFVTPPQAHELPQRLRGRQTETEESIAKRLNTAYHESFQINRYDFLVINDDLDKAVEQTHQMIQNGRFLVRRNETFIKNIQEQLKNYAKGEQL